MARQNKSPDGKTLYHESARLQRFCERHGRKYHRASGRVAQSLSLLSEAEKLIQGEAKDLKRGVLDFRGARQSLRSLCEVLAEVEADHAAGIHPDLRTQAEKELAQRARWKFGHPDLRITVGSAQLQHEATGLLVKLIQRFSHGRVPSGHINRFISIFFWEALGQAVTSDNVNTMRVRLRAPRRKHAPPRPNVVRQP